MQKHYDVEIFEKYLMWKKEDGNNIDNWEMSGLKDAVKDFKANFPHAINYDYIAQKSKDIHIHSASKRLNF